MRMLFFRDFHGLTGGHLKVWHYFNHVRHLPGYRPLIHFSKDSLWDESNPWRPLRDQVLPHYQPAQSDYLFLAGLDWRMLSHEERIRPVRPIINLIQGVGHAQPGDPRYGFLHYRAIRICVSAEIAERLRETGRVNGPLHVIPNGLDLNELPLPAADGQSDLDLLIVGLKNPSLARQLHAQLATSAGRIELLAEPLPRRLFLSKLARAKIALFLPLPAEGFYLPALEGMALGALVICPDCIGNRSFCLPEKTCLRPPYTLKALLEAVENARRLAVQERDRLLKNAAQKVLQHDLLKERRAFHRLLRGMLKSSACNDAPGIR